MTSFALGCVLAFMAFKPVSAAGFFDSSQTADLGGGIHWNSLLGWFYAEEPYVYSYTAGEWLRLYGESEQEGYSFWRYKEGHWGWTASELYPVYVEYQSGGLLYVRAWPSAMVLVEGGTLPAVSALGYLDVSTFYMGKYEVTWGEWQTVGAWAASNGYDIDSQGEGCADDHPVRSVNWYDVVKWCNAKSEMEGLAPVYTVSGLTYKSGQPSHTSIYQNLSASGYRLPQKAEWEFAASGGNQTHGYTYSGSNTVGDVAWYRDNASGALCNLSGGRGTWSVGEKAANELGLYDMSGNVWEWCWDAHGSYRFIRGGSWNDDANACPVWSQLISLPDTRFNLFGFRLARSSEHHVRVWPSEMVLVEGGTLPVLSEIGDLDVSTFYIGKYEVIWGEWQEVRAWAVSDGYDIGSAGVGCSDDHPVHTVNWYDVVKWCNAKSEMEGLTAVYTVSGATYKSGEPSHASISQNLSASGYRLPQEAEWEFAARGGNQTHGYTYSGSDDLDAVGWYDGNSSGAACNLSVGRGIWPVGEKTANELGLHDMSGNVEEWCWDANDSFFRHIRGGGWSFSAYDCTVSSRYYRYPGYRFSFYGFRLARTPSP